MNCEEALKKLYEIVDNEATPKDKEEIKKHLEHCRHCMSRYEFEDMFKKLICDKTTSNCDTSRLKKNILDKIDRAEKSSGSVFSNPMKYKSIFLATAAALIICIIAALATAKFYKHKTMIHPFELHHLAYADYNGDAVDDLAQSADVASFINNDLGLTIRNNFDDYQLTNAGFDDILDHHYAHLRYQKDGRAVSVFMGHPGDITIPDFTKRTFAGIEYFEHICNDCQVIYWFEGGALIVVVSDNLSHDLTSFIPALASI